MSCSDRERTGRLLHRTVVMTTVCCWVELPLFTCCQVAKEHLACSVNKSQPFPEQNMVLGQCAASKMKPGLASDLLRSVCLVSRASEGSGRTTAGRWRQSGTVSSQWSTSDHQGAHELLRVLLTSRQQATHLCSASATVTSNLSCLLIPSHFLGPSQRQGAKAASIVIRGPTSCPPYSPKMDRRGQCSGRDPQSAGGEEAVPTSPPSL